MLRHWVVCRGMQNLLKRTVACRVERQGQQPTLARSLTGHNQPVDQVCFRESQHADSSGAVRDVADVSRSSCLQCRGSHNDLSSAA